MRIGFAGAKLPEGKIRYQDEDLAALAAKDRPRKVSPYFAEFMREDYTRADVIAVSRDRVLDLLIADMERLEARVGRTADGAEKALMTKCLQALEQETPLCEVLFDEVERTALRAAGPVSLKPVLVLDEGVEANAVIALALQKARYMFFYTSGPTESHAWLVSQGSDIVTCAGRIHTDLARGFIKGDVVPFEDYMRCHSFNDCRAKGLAKLVDRDYVVQPREVLEIRFKS